MLSPSASPASGGNSAAGYTASCAAGLPPFQAPRIVDVTDETKPVVVSHLYLEIHDPKNCDKVLPDTTGLSSFIYGSHYCSVDNKRAATTLACGYFESGIRVFDIRDPTKPKEIAYFNPPAVTTISPGSQNNRTTTGRPDHCSAPSPPRCGDGEPADDLPGQRLPVAQVHQWRLAIPGKHLSAGIAELICAK